jgi:glucose/arabinose dehydrogenase
MAHRGRRLLAGALTAMLLACQPASAAPPRPAAEVSGVRAEPQAVEPPQQAAPGAATDGSSRQANGGAPRIALEALPFGFQQPLFLTHAGDGSGRKFVVEKGGTIRVVKGDQVLSTPFLDISSRVLSSGSEQGLLGLAFHPRYTENGRFFVGYTDRRGRNTVERYEVSADADRADPSTGVILLSIDDPAPNHNGGMVLFGPDGYLWVGTGDGGGAGDRFRNGQNPRTLLGKMLRLDVDGGEPYAIPPDNPYVGQSDFRPEIWAIGLRNPWRYAFDRINGDLWIADVGQNAFEEINRVPGGNTGALNFGWPLMEGLHCFPASARCDPAPFVEPVAEYGRDGGCSVTGGYVYRGPAYPTLQGMYFFGDFCSGKIWSLDQTGGANWRMTEQLKDPIQISSFGEDESGEIYVTTFSGGSDGHRVYRVVAR